MSTLFMSLETAIKHHSIFTHLKKRKTKHQKHGPRCCENYIVQKLLLPEKQLLVLPIGLAFCFLVAKTLFQKLNQI